MVGNNPSCCAPANNCHRRDRHAQRRCSSRRQRHAQQRNERVSVSARHTCALRYEINRCRRRSFPAACGREAPNRGPGGANKTLTQIANRLHTPRSIFDMVMTTRTRMRTFSCRHSYSHMRHASLSSDVIIRYDTMCALCRSTSLRCGQHSATYS